MPRLPEYYNFKIFNQPMTENDKAHASLYDATDITSTVTNAFKIGKRFTKINIVSNTT